MSVVCKNIHDIFLGPREYNVVVEGLPGCGKTAVINRLMERATKHSLENESGCLLYYKHAVFKIHEGIETCEALPIHALIMVIDSSQRHLTIDSRLKMYTLLESPKMAPDVKVLVMNNKIDINYASAHKKAVEMGLHGRCYSKWFVKSCSAAENLGFKEAIERLYLAVTDRDNFHTTNVDPENVNPYILG